MRRASGRAGGAAAAAAAAIEAPRCWTTKRCRWCCWVSGGGEEEEEEEAALLDGEIDCLYALPPHELQARFLDLHGPLLGARFGPELHGPLPSAATVEAFAALAAVAAAPLPRNAMLQPWRRAPLLALFASTQLTAAAAELHIFKKRQRTL